MNHHAFSVATLLVVLVGVQYHHLSAAPGDLDRAFGTSGKVVTPFGMNSGGQSLLVQPDGKLLVGGDAKFGGVQGFALVRYRMGGSLDPSFGIAGKVVSFFPHGFASGKSVALQPDGKIILSGSAFNGVTDGFALARYFPDGTLDPSFNQDGKVNVPFLSGGDSGESLLVQPDGKIVVAGYVLVGDYDFGLMRFTANGDLDGTFGSGGKVSVDFGTGDDFATCAVRQPDGKIIVAGEARIAAKNDFGLARFNENGTIDISFDHDGITSTHFGGGDDGISSIVLLPNGKILVAGVAEVGGQKDIALARYHPGGARDNTFGNDGKVTVDFDGAFDGARGVAIQPDGKILVGGVATINGTRHFALARFLADGTPDTTFHQDGKLTTSFGGHATAAAIAMQMNGRIVLAGFSLAGSNQFTMAGYQGIIYQPDNRVGTRKKAEKGNDIYNRSGARQKITVFGRSKFFFSVQNDAEITDALLILAPRKDRKFRVRYRAAGFGNVTNAITGAGFGILTVNPGQRIAITAKVRPKSDRRKTLRIRTQSLSDPSKQDLIKVRLRPE